MSTLRRLVMLRHGNTVGNSHERFHGSSDVPLSEEGRRQVLGSRPALAREVFDLVVASPLSRAWESAQLLVGAHPIRLLPELREVDFGHWEGLTAEEIEARDPALYRVWQERPTELDYPGGERRSDFTTRVIGALAALERSGAANVLLVAHKGVIRVLYEHLCGESLERELPHLGGVVSVTRAGDRWLSGRRASEPGALGEVA